jgi:hypothetical protein
MLGSMKHQPPNPSRTRALYARDAGLRRVSTVTRIVVVASVAAAGAFTAVAAWAQPGRSKSTTSPTRVLGGDRSSPLTVPATTPSTLPQDNAGTAPGDVGTVPGDVSIAPPDTLPDPGYSYPPATSYYPPPVVSGAS